MFPLTYKDDAPSILSTKDMVFINGQQLGEYIAQMPVRAERISQSIGGFAQGQFEITAPFCMYELGYSSLSKDL